MDSVGVGKRIHDTRIEKEMTLQDVADIVGVARSTIQRYEKGLIDNLKLPVLEAIARSLNVNPAWLVFKSEIKDIHEDVVCIATAFKVTGDELFGLETSVLDYSDIEKQLITDFRSLNEEGQQDILKYVWLIVESGKYKKTDQIGMGETKQA